MNDSTASSIIPSSVNVGSGQDESMVETSGLTNVQVTGESHRTHLEVRKSTISGTYGKKTPKVAIPFRTKDIVKIFAADDRDEYVEVTPEQLERVKMMHEKMEDGTTFSFNYNCLLFVASILAGLGLASNCINVGFTTDGSCGRIGLWNDYSRLEISS
jgi:hypothetical protein